MKALVLMVAGLVCVLAVFLGGLFVMANVMTEPEPHKFAHLEAPDLWTSAPVKIDPTKQSYERLPALPVVASIAASDMPGQTVAKADRHEDTTLDISATGSIDTKARGEGGSPIAETMVVEPSQAQWCFARYRSYRAEDNSYQPLSGGPRRQCMPPNRPAASAVANRSVQAEAVRETASAGWPPQTGNAGQARSHVEWCMTRYRSYRMDDNTYQPFDGGPRRSCESPFG